MFWRFGGYANISTIDTILDKPDFTLEDLLDESDLIQELKQHNTKLIEYLREDHILEKLLQYVVAPKLESVESEAGDEPAATGDAAATSASEEESSRGKTRLLPFSRPRASSRATDVTDTDEDEQEKKRNRYAFVACEVLSSDTWSIYEALAENRQLIREFWSFLSRDAPLDPLQASYFTKVNESLFEKKTDEMMDLLKSLPDAVSHLLRHVECPMIMDLLLKIIALDRTEGGQGVVEWLFSKDIIPTLLSCLGPEHSWVVQTAAGDFIKAIITISANASQNEQQCIGPNELTRQLVSKECAEQLIGYMLSGGNPLTVGVGIVIEVIRKNNSDYDPDVGAESNAVPTSRDPIYLGTLLRLFAQNVPKFMTLIMDGPTQKPKHDSTFGQKLEPLGFDRFKTCELMAELLHCSNMGLLNEVGSEQLIAARDLERQRLRTDGQLGPIKEEEPSTEDLTMRIPQAQEETRGLQVTNADDDEFEEVEPSKDIGEDTSHEYVKAEQDLDQPPPTSFLEKDEDEFVDEPLSSPRLAVGADKINEQQFEEPDLVVAPLSPTKPRPAEPALTIEPAHSESHKDLQSQQAKDLDPKMEKPLAAGSESQDDASKEETSSTPEAALTPATESVPEIKLNDAKEVPDAEGLATPDRDLSPHPEDTPAPLFAASAASAEKAPKAEKTDEQQATAATETSAPEIAEANTSADPAADQSSLQEPSSVDPVVGDYLKMQFVEHRVVPTILSFFFAYPWNNFLHNVVYDIVQQVFNGPMDRGYNPTLAVSLFEAADVTTAIIEGQKASDESQAKTRTRMGYMGHLTLIAEEVVKFTERHPPELLSDTVLDKVMSQEWINYVEGALAETRERDNAILGGVRPEVALGHRGSIGASNGLGGVGLSGLGGGSSGSGNGTSSGAASNALAEAGLNGGLDMNDNGNSGIGPFAISAGTLMSGFGSSSDEEDEEGDGEDEDVNSEFRAYTDSLNSSGGSMAPPSIPPPPPPPPPLNIPPSRARMQLAARLAMHQKNNQGAKALAGFSEDQEEEDDSHLDPFADAERDLDDDEDEDALSPGADEEAEDRAKGSWWRGVVSGGRRKSSEGNESDDDRDEDDDEEFGDFAMAEDEKTGGEDADNVVLKPLAVNPTKETTRSLGGLWPFGSKGEKDKGKAESTSTTLGGSEEKVEDAGVVKDELSSQVAGEEKHAIEVKEAKRRTSIEDPDEEVDVGAEFVAGTS